MTPCWSSPIWDAYQSHRDIDQLRQDILTTPWYRAPVNVDESLLVRAVESCDVAAARLLMEIGEKPDLPCDDGFTLLHTAVDVARENQSPDAVALIECLLQNGANPNVQGIDGTPLHRAAGAGLTSVVDALLRHGTDIEARTLVDGGLTPLMHAALMGAPETVKQLLDSGADPSARCAAYWGSLTAEELVQKQNSRNATMIVGILKHAHGHNPRSATSWVDHSR